MKVNNNYYDWQENTGYNNLNSECSKAKKTTSTTTVSCSTEDLRRKKDKQVPN